MADRPKSELSIKISNFTLEANGHRARDRKGSDQDLEFHHRGPTLAKRLVRAEANRRLEPCSFFFWAKVFSFDVENMFTFFFINVFSYFLTLTLRRKVFVHILPVVVCVLRVERETLVVA